MRLLNVNSYEFSEYPDERHTPPYGILSHRWQDGEVSYQDMLSGKAEIKKGYTKLKDFCQNCKADDYDFAWIDTCCIDKTDSTELAEAITSMYRWYQKSAKCYVYLYDIDQDDSGSIFHSRWFSRSWTLQELVAPQNVHFYDRAWVYCGDKIQHDYEISKRCKIPVEVLHGKDPRKYSTMQRMSWSFGRTTTRAEDRAYSLLGLFDIAMPIQYGEGMRAFTRLQEEIKKDLPDATDFDISKFLPQYVDKEVQTDSIKYVDHYLQVDACEETVPEESSTTESHEIRWQAIRMLGKGTFAVVEEVRESSHGFTYARKSISRSRKGISELDIEKRVRKEVEIMTKLQHNHIPKVATLLQGKATWDIIMLSVADCNLREYLEDRCIASNYEIDAIRSMDTWFGCLISALAFAHTKRIKHEDIKPANILIKRRHVFLADFGTAQDFSELEGSITHDYFEAGAPVYWAPEPRPRGPAADVFALGCVFAEILTVRRKRSLHEFRLYRCQSQADFKYAFKYGLPKTRQWLTQDLIRMGDEDYLTTVTEQVLNMILEEPGERPKARRVRKSLRTEEQLFCFLCA